MKDQQLNHRDLYVLQQVRKRITLKISCFIQPSLPFEYQLLVLQGALKSNKTSLLLTHTLHNTKQCKLQSLSDAAERNMMSHLLETFCDRIILVH